MNCEIALVSRSPNRRDLADLLLLHQFGVRAIIDHILSKDRCSQDSINLLRVDILQLAIENEVVALSSQIHCCLLAK